MDSSLVLLYQSSKTVFTRDDLALIWKERDASRLNSKISYYSKKGSLKKLTRGVYAKGREYRLKDLATSIYAPSYISFETVLKEAGVIFQHSDALFVATRRSKTMTINTHRLVFRKMKDLVLYSSAGITSTASYSIASLERAFLDMIYLFPRYYFDNLGTINWEKCRELVGIYGNYQLEKRLASYQKSYGE